MHPVTWIALACLYGHSLINRPSVLEALPEHRGTEPKLLRPLSNSLSTSIPLNKDARALVVQVLSPCYPSAVSGLVVPVNVDAVDLMGICGRHPHISNKCSKRGAPSVAHFDTASTVVLEVVTGRAGASTNHVLPATRNARSGESVELGFSSVERSGASARTIMPGVQVSCACDVLTSAVAGAAPSSLVILDADELLNDQTSEPLSDQVMLTTTHDAPPMRVEGRASLGVNTRAEARFILAKAA